MLAAGSPDERWAAARRSTAPENVALLGDALAREQDKRVREAIFTVLAQIGTDEAVRVVLPYIRDPDAVTRTEAVDALCTMSRAASPHLPALLSDANSDVRLLACEVVRQLPAPEANRLLCGLLEVEGEPNVCAAAVEVLSEVGEPSALPVLAKCAQRFVEVSFLAFAIQIAATRISNSAPGADPA